MQLLLGTGNPGKIREISEALKGLDIRIITPADVGIADSPHEEGDTFADNARQKARFYFERSEGIPTVADDSGIFVEALADELGVHTRRWGLGQDVDDLPWIEYFLQRMSEETDRRACFLSVIVFIDKQGNEYAFEGRDTGYITHTLEGPFAPGLPFDGCFVPDGFDRVYGLLSSEEKNRISHRGRALQQLRDFLSTSFPSPGRSAECGGRGVRGEGERAA